MLKYCLDKTWKKISCNFLLLLLLMTFFFYLCILFPRLPSFHPLVCFFLTSFCNPLFPLPFPSECSNSLTSLPSGFFLSFPRLSFSFSFFALKILFSFPLFIFPCFWTRDFFSLLFRCLFLYSSSNFRNSIPETETKPDRTIHD